MLLLQASITKYMPNQPTKEVGGEAHEAPKRGRPRKAVGAESGAAKAPETSRGRGKGAARKGKQAAAAAASHDDMANDADAPPSSAAVVPAEQAAVSAEVSALSCKPAYLLHVNISSSERQLSINLHPLSTALSCCYLMKADRTARIKRCARINQSSFPHVLQQILYPCKQCCTEPGSTGA